MTTSTGYHAPPRGPVDVSLSTVYGLDFGRRDADLPTWSALDAVAGAGPVVDAGCGDGRATRLLVAGGRTVHGVDVDPVFVGAARARGLYADACALDDDYPCGGAALVICAYSTLWLVPHARQVGALSSMAVAARRGGIVAVEVFVPAMLEDREVEQPCADPNDPSRPPWVRRSRFRVDRTGQRTDIERLYGPARGAWTMRLRETVYWRDPEKLLLLAERAGLRQSRVATGDFSWPGTRGNHRVPVAPGHALLVARR